MRPTLRLVFFLLATFPALAEPPDEDILRPRLPSVGTFFVGFDIGLNTTWFDGNPIYRAFFRSEEESRLFRSAFGLEPLATVYAGIRLTPEISVRLRGDYDIRAADRKGTTVDQCPLIDASTGEIVGSIPVDVEKQYNLEVTYLTFSLLGEYHLGRAFVFLGPAWALPMNRTFTEIDRIVNAESVCVYFPGTTDSTHEIRADITGTDNVKPVVSFKLGVGYKIAMSAQLTLVPQIGIDLPFGSSLKTDEDYVFRRSTGGEESITTRLNHHMYFRALQASIGLRYSF